MSHVHRRLSDEQVRLLLQGYCQGQLRRCDLQEVLGIGRSRFLDLLKAYRQEPQAFSVAYKRSRPPRLSQEVEAAMESALLRERAIVEDPDLPISGYNYAAIRDRLQSQSIVVSVTTIIDRAKRLGCHKPRRRRRVHDREVLTASVGALVQHDTCTHLWSPFAQEK